MRLRGIHKMEGNAVANYRQKVAIDGLKSSFTLPAPLPAMQWTGISRTA
jgi:hypothetical protein